MSRMDKHWLYHTGYMRYSREVNEVHILMIWREARKYTCLGFGKCWLHSKPIVFGSLATAVLMFSSTEI